MADIIRKSTRDQHLVDRMSLFRNALSHINLVDMGDGEISKCLNVFENPKLVVNKISKATKLPKKDVIILGSIDDRVLCMKVDGNVFLINFSQTNSAMRIPG